MIADEQKCVRISQHQKKPMLAISSTDKRLGGENEWHNSEVGPFYIL